MKNAPTMLKSKPRAKRVVDKFVTGLLNDLRYEAGQHWRREVSRMMLKISELEKENARLRKIEDAYEALSDAGLAF